MNGGTPRHKMSGSGTLTRRSPRLGSPLLVNSKADAKMAEAPVAVKRSITVRKIVPRKTVAPSDHDKENTPRPSEAESGPQKKRSGSTPGPTPTRGSCSSAGKKKPSPRQSQLDPEDPKQQKISTPAAAAPNRGRSSSSAGQKRSSPRLSAQDQEKQKKQKVSTPGPAPDHGRSSSSSGKKKNEKKAVMPSPILPPSPPPSRPLDPGDAVWSQKVRRSYSRLSDKSLHHSPDPRETLFGFEKLQTPEVGQKVRRCNAGMEASGSLSGLHSFTSLIDAEDGGVAEPDPNIPGVAVVKEKRTRRKKVQQIVGSELDALAAEMNAVFDEADAFELVVE